MRDPAVYRSEFERIIREPEPSLDLARAALLVAAEADPTIDVDEHMRTLERWGDEFRGRLDPGWNNLQKLARLRAFVFEELGFAGDEREYYSPSNSLLHEVLRRRRGVPLTLAIVFMELGWRADMPFEGVGFPGHFLIRLNGEPGDLLLDPFTHGRSMHEEDCRRILLDLTGGRLEFDVALTRSVGKREMLARLLQNLKGAYLRASDDQGALAAVERLLLLKPTDPEETRDRGLLLFRLQRFGPALECLESYLERRPAAYDAERMRDHVQVLRGRLASLN